MTKLKLFERFRNDSDVNYATEILLKHAEWGLVESCIKAELNLVNEKIKELEEQGYIYYLNGTYHTAWSKAENLNGWNLTEEQENAYLEAKEKCYEAESLIYNRNRLECLYSRCYS